MTPPDSGPATSAAAAPGGFDKLTAVLRTRAPESLAALPADQLEELADLIEQANQRLLQELSYAALGALDNVPGFLRPVVRKAVGR
ncbi:hypothetical protein [Nocardia inohanensis]|uniref:hypothetical protein n=1 Tax=Nocardia inohanensis TaxID=209246 RepID=UPI000831AD19|nr:hypothetical protein [Nocardia inohanensis]